jgi:hypothetical protein
MIMVVIVARVIVWRSRLRITTISADFRLEWRGRHADVEAEFPHHAVEHVVVLVSEPPRLNLQGNVTIAQVVGGTREQMRIAAACDRYLLRSSTHAHDLAAVLGTQAIAIA